MTLRIAFFGTPAFAVPSLQAIAASRHPLVAVVSQPDRPRGRGHHLVATPVRAAAESLGVPVLQPPSLRTPLFDDVLRAFAPDLGVVAAYGQILPASLLAVPRLGMINVHASLLPRWRGAAPVHRAILAGDRETGVTIMRVVSKLDAGPILARAPVPIAVDETSAELETRLAAVGAALLVRVIDQMDSGAITEQPQDEASVTYAARIDRRERSLDWAQPATRVHDTIRGLQPWPLAATVLRGHRLLLHRSAAAPDVGHDADPGTVIAVEPDAIVVATAPGAVRLLVVQPEGRPAMPVRSYLAGHRVAAGDRCEPPDA